MKKLSEQIREVGQGVMIVAMTPQEAIKIVNEADLKAIEQALQKEGVTAGALLNALKVLFPAVAFAAPISAEVVDTLMMKIKDPKTIQLSDVKQINQSMNVVLKQQADDQISVVKKLIEDAKSKPGKSFGGALSINLAGGKYSPGNEGQAKVLQGLSRLEKIMGKNPVAMKTIKDLLKESGIR